MNQNEQVDNTIYEDLGERWYSAFDDPVALLRAESKLKVRWVVEAITKSAAAGDRVLDIGCGAGFISNALALQNFCVTGIDLSGASLEVAKSHDATKSVQYRQADAYHLPFPDASFDFVTAMDFLEHVDDPLRTVQEAARVLKPGGLYFFHTFNRNWVANIVIIKMVETFVKNTPKNMHVLRLFITPQELEIMCRQSGLQTKDWTGLRPKFSTVTWKSLRTGTVPEDFAFTFTKSLKLSYMGYATKAPSPIHLS